MARRNLVFSILTEHIGFSVWSLWSVLVLFLGPELPRRHRPGKFFLTAIPTAGRRRCCGCRTRFAVARFGGRNWTVVSACCCWCRHPGGVPDAARACRTPRCMVVAAVAGVGGGNFASSMANINAFYPQRLKGWALGLNAGGGNIGVADGAAGRPARSSPRPAPRTRGSCWRVYIPLIVLAALCAALFMDNLAAGAQRHGRARARSARDPHTWIMSVLYIGTFGSFIGYGFAFGQVLQVQFGTHPAPGRLPDLPRPAARARWSGRSAAGWPTGSAAPGSPAGTSPRWPSAAGVVLAASPDEVAAGVRRRLHPAVRASAASATARRTR